MSREDMALGPKIQISLHDIVAYKGGGKGKVIATNARTPAKSESTYPTYTQDADTGAVYAHREDGSLGIAGGSEFDIVTEPESFEVHVRIYRGLDGHMHAVAAIGRDPDTPLPHVAAGTCTVKL